MELVKLKMNTFKEMQVQITRKDQEKQKHSTEPLRKNKVRKTYGSRFQEPYVKKKGELQKL